MLWATLRMVGINLKIFVLLVVFMLSPLGI